MPSRYLSIEEQVMLAKRAAEGDEGAWQELHEHFNGALTGKIRGWVGDLNVAKELAQATWIYAWKKIGTYDSQYSFYVFLLNFAKIIIKRYFGSGGSLLFRVSDLKDPTGLAIKLRDAQDPLSQYLRGQFSTNTQQLLDEYDGSNPPCDALRRAVIDELNRLLKGNCLYDEQRFMQVKLTEEAQGLIEQNLEGEDLIRLNRLLLEEAYPREIKKSRKKRKQMSEVEILLPDIPPPPDKEIVIELLLITFRCCAKPHQLIAFVFNKLLEWKPQEIVEELSDNPLKELSLKLREDYCSCFHPFEEEIAPCFSPLLEKMERDVREVYTEPEYLERLRDVMDQKVGSTCLRDYCGDNPTASIGDWANKVKERARRAIEEGIFCRE